MSRKLPAQPAGGLSRSGLGRLSGISGTAIQNIESAGTRPGLDTIEELALALKVSPCWLAYGEGQGPLTHTQRHGPFDQ